MVYLEKCDEYKTESIYEIISRWRNIFKHIIKRGDRVVLKPNWIAESHKYRMDEWISVITHPSVITAVLQIIIEFLAGSGRIIITDGPQTSSSWEKIMSRMMPENWIRMGQEHSIDVSLVDLREDAWITKGDIIVERRKLAGDPLGFTVCNLEEKSEFHAEGDSSVVKYCAADYDTQDTNIAHSSGKHLYKVSRTVLESDVFINLPKLKTHKKAGITASLKNLVGINTYKNWLPHYKEGTPSEGGDQYPDDSLRNVYEGSLSRIFYDFLVRKPYLAKPLIPVKKVAKYLLGDARRTIRSGNWYGNDTLWRTVLDLNKILLYANGDGTFREASIQNRKKYISIVDAIVSGEGNGPEAPDRKDTGLLIMGTNPTAVDAVCAKIMGFDWKKIPMLYNSFSIKDYPISDLSYDDIQIVSTQKKYSKKLSEIDSEETFSFVPPLGWRGRIEENV